MKKNSMLETLKYTNLFCTIFGLKIMELNRNNDLKNVSLTYKIYSCISTILIVTRMSIKIVQNYIQMMIEYNSLSMAYIYIMTISLVIILLIYVTIKNVSIASKTSKSIYTTLMKADTKLKFENQKQNDGAAKHLLTFYFTFIALKIIQAFANSSWSNMQNWTYHLLCTIVDFHLMRFIFEVHMLARRFEVLNHCLRSCSHVELNDYVHDCISIRIWRIKNHFRVVNGVQNERFEKLLSVHNDLIRVLNKFNAQYGLMVNIALIFKKKSLK